MVRDKMQQYLRRYSHNSSSGFTMVEVFVAMVIFSMAVVSLSLLYSSIQYAQRSSRYVDIAAQAARAKIELLRGPQYSILSQGQTVDFTDKLSDDLPTAGRHGEVLISRPSDTPNVYQLDVTVSYEFAGQTKNVKITAYADKPGGSS